MSFDDISGKSQRLHKYEGTVIGRWAVTRFFPVAGKYLIQCSLCKEARTISTQTITDGHDLRRQYCKCVREKRVVIHEMLDDGIGKTEIARITGYEVKTIAYHIRTYKPNVLVHYNFAEVRTFPDIGKELGIPTTTVKSIHDTAMKKMREYLDTHEEENYSLHQTLDYLDATGS